MTDRRPAYRLPAELTIRFLVLVFCVAVLTMRLFSAYASSRVLDPGTLDPDCRAYYGEATRFPLDPVRLSDMQFARPECFVAENPFPVSPQLFALLLLAALVGLQLVVLPFLKIRLSLTDLKADSDADSDSDSGSGADSDALLAKCRTTSGVDVDFLLAAGNRRIGGVAFGYPWRKHVAINAGLLPLAKHDPEAFRGVVLHELAHVRDGDVGVTALTLATWRAFVVVTLIPFAYLSVADDRFARLAEGGITAAQLIPFALVALVARNGVLHAREYLADARAAQWAGGSGPLSGHLARYPAQNRVGTLFGFHPSAHRRREALDGSRPLWLTGLFDALLLGVVTGLAWPSVAFVVHGGVFFDARVVPALLALWPLTAAVGIVLATGLWFRQRSDTGLLGAVFAVGLLVGTYATGTGSALGQFPLDVPWSRDLPWGAAVLLTCWLWALLVEATARSWDWAHPRRAALLGVTAGAAVLTVVLAPVLATRLELGLDDPDTISRLTDFDGGATGPVVAAVVALAALLPLAGVLGRKLNRVGPPLVAVALAVLLAGGGVVVLRPEVYGDTLVVALCGADPANPDRCPKPLEETDKVLLIDYIRRHGGSAREYERDGVTYVEVRAVPGGGARLAGLVLAREGVDSVESLP